MGTKRGKGSASKKPPKKKNKAVTEKSRSENTTNIPNEYSPVVPEKLRLILFWIIFIILLFTRVYQFGKVPGDINQDEAFAGYNAYTLAHTGRDSFGYTMPMYLTAWGSGMNALESYLAIPFVAIFGVHAWSLRLVPLICAMCSLVALYKMSRKFGNDILALFVLLFAGITPWHIMLSTCALESDLAPAFLVFGVFFFLMGMENEKFFLLSALFYGLSLYAYATIWAVVPFIVLLQVLYLILCKKIHLSKYTLLSLVVLGVIALPALLFLFVNQGKINEIRTPFLSVPKLLYFRGSEISLEHLSENFSNLWNIIRTQDDGLPWNSTPEYGLFYHRSLPFALIGVVYAFVQMIRKCLKKEFSIEIILFVQMLAGLAVGVLINVNVNRVNLIFFPIICFIACGIYVIFGVGGSKLYGILKRDKKITGRAYSLMIVPVVVYLVFLIRFEQFYFTDYKALINAYFCEGLENALEFTRDDLADVQNVCITPNVSYARVLFYVREDLEEYLDTVEYTNYPSAFLDVSSFGRYRFAFDANGAADGVSVYLLDTSYQGTPLVQSLEAGGYQAYTSGYYTVYYPG